MEQDCLTPLVPPVKRKDARDLMTPKTSWARTLEIFPVLESGRRSSKRVPLETTISCCLTPEKFPSTAAVTAVGDWRVKLYKCMILRRAEVVVEWSSPRFQAQAHDWSAMEDSSRQSITYMDCPIKLSNTWVSMRTTMDISC
jgi:hypothetical protein